MPNWTQEELTCPECGQVFLDKRGLNGHRMFKHSVHPSAPQLPLVKQDLLVSESKLEELLDARFAVISEQVDALNSALEQQDGQQGERIKQLEERLIVAERKTIDDFAPVEKAEFVIPWLKGLDGEDFVRLSLETGHDAQLVPAVDPGASAAVAEIMRKQDETPPVIKGKTELPGYRYLERINRSVYVGEEELVKERQELVNLVAKRLSEGLEKLGDRVVNTAKIATELVANLAEIQRRREQATRKR